MAGEESGAGVTFVGKTAVVTGAASGAGRATAMAFGEAGADVALLDVNEEGAREVAERMDASRTKVAVYKVDMADVPSVRATLQAVQERFGRLDALANVAAIYPKALVSDVTEEFWDRIQAIDVRGVFFCCQEAIRLMTAQDGGAIVNVASTIVWNPLVGHASYGAAKAGLVGMSRILALEYANKGVRVNVVAPGHIAGTGASLRADTVARSVTPEEIANAIVWLCSDGASGINGGTVHVNSGNFMP